MRKTFLASALLMCIGAYVHAQDAQDAKRYSFNEYYGTARSVSMGNAFTALGGDLGSIGINPAGSAVNGYSQITITPNISIAGVSTTYDPSPGLQGSNQSFKINTDRTRLTVPNVGFIVNWDPQDNSGIKGISFGLVANTTANYSSRISGRGINAESSVLGEKGQFFSDNQYNWFNFFDQSGNARRDAFNNYSWEDVLAVQTGMITTYGGSDTNWIGATETIFPDGSVGTAGLLEQTWNRVTSGYKYDIVTNLGLNFSDQFYLGANLGIIAMEYNSDTQLREYASNPNDFFIPFDDGDTYFDNMLIGNWYKAHGEGIYGKVGFIYVPVPEFRIGGAIQTPTRINIKEQWLQYADIVYTDNIHSASADSPDGEFEYRLNTPFRFNVGAAFNFGSGVLSADYEYCDYSKMRFREADGYTGSSFYSVNQDIKDFMGASHILRVGAELKLVPEFAMRAGYNLCTSPDYENTNGSKKAVDATRHSIALGFGYSSAGSFFCDFAVKGTFLPDEYIYPYNNYITGINSPEMTLKKNFWDVMVTFGWRF